MKTVYETPAFDVITLLSADVITVSALSGNDNGKDDTFEFDFTV